MSVMAGDIAGSPASPFPQGNDGNQTASKAGSDKAMLKEGVEIISADSTYRHVIRILKGPSGSLI